MSRKGNPSISFRVSKELKRALEDEADAQSMEFSSYVREALSNRSSNQFNYKATLERIQQKNEELQVQNKQLQEELNDNNSPGFEIQTQQIQQAYESQITELKNQLQEQVESDSDEDIAKMKQGYEQTIADLKHQLQELEVAIEIASEKIDGVHTERVNQLAEQIKELQAYAENDVLLIEELRVEVSNATSNEEEKLVINDLNAKQEVMQKELDNTAVELVIAQEELGKIFQVNKLNEEKIKQLVKDCHQLEEKSNNQKSEVKETEVKNSELESNYQYLQEKSEEMTQEMHRLKRENFMINDEVKSLKKFSNKEEVLELRKTAATLKKENEELSNERLFHAKKRTQVIRLNDTLEEDKENLEMRVENLEESLSIARLRLIGNAENEERKVLVEQLTEDSQRYQQDCDDKDSAIGDLEEQIEEQKSTIETLQSQLENLEEEGEYDEDEEYEDTVVDEEDTEEYTDDDDEEDDYITYTEVIPVPSVTEFTESENELYSELITELHVRYPHETIERLILGCLEANRANERGVLWTKTVAGGLKLLNAKV